MTKVRMTIRGDTDDPNFHALQGLILDCGFMFGIQPLEKDGPPLLTHQGGQLNGHANSGKRMFRQGNGKTAGSTIVEYLSTHNGRASYEELQRYLVATGYATKTTDATLSRLKRNLQVREDRHGIIYLHQPTAGAPVEPEVEGNGG